MSAARLPLLTALLPLFGAALVACGGETSTTGERSPDGSLGPEQSVEAAAALCGDRISQAHAFAVVTTEAQRTARNDCGDVAFVDASGAVWVQRIEMSAASKIGQVPTDAVSATKLAVSPTGKYLVYSAPDGAHQIALDAREAETVHALLPLDELGFVHRGPNAGAPGEDLVVLCGKTGGLRLAGAPVSTETAGCARLQAPGGPYAAARVDAQPGAGVLVLSARDGEARVLSALSEGLSAGGPMLGDPVSLSFSPDGRALFFEQRFAPSTGGDFFYYTQMGIRVVDLDSDQTGPLTPLLHGMVGLDASAAAYFVPAGPHRAAVVAPDSGFYVDQAGAVHLLGRRGLKAIDPTGKEGIFLDTSGGANANTVFRRPLDDGPAKLLATGAGGVRGTDDFAQLVVSKLPTDGIRYPDNPGVSHKQLWDATRVDAKGETTIATSTQPLTPVWVGKDGATLLRGGLADTPLPKVAAPADVPIEIVGLHAFDAQGTRLATVPDEGSQTYTLLKHGVLLDRFQATQGFRFVFVSGHGERTELAPEGASKLGSVQERFVDGTREIAVVSGPGSGAVATRVVLAGALPR